MLSEEQLEAFDDRCYYELICRAGMVKVSETIFRCPYCYIHEKRDYTYEDLLRHAAFIGGSADQAMDVRDKLRHIVLERYTRIHHSPLETSGISFISKAEPMYIPLGQSGEKRANLSHELDQAYPSKRACLIAGAEEGEEKVAQHLTQLKSLEDTIQRTESAYDEASRELEMVTREKEEMINTHNKKMTSAQQLDRENLARMYKEHEKLNQHLENQMKECEEREKYLDKCQARNKTERRKLQWQKHKNLMDAQEQSKVEAKMLKLGEQHQREKKELHKKVLELEKLVEADQALELEIERMRGDKEVMGCMQEGEECGMKEETKEYLKKREEYLEEQESLYQTLVVNHGNTNEEFQHLRETLIKSLEELKVGPCIGVKRMGALDVKLFHKVAKEIYPEEEAGLRAAELCSLWDDHLRDSTWHPLKVIIQDGTPKEVLNEEDEKLQELRNELGEEAFEAVTQALKERNEYNGSGRYVVPELWNFREERKATLKEGVGSLINLWKRNKPKPKSKAKPKRSFF